MANPQQIGSTALKLLLWSLAVGLVLSLLDVTPLRLISNLGQTLRDLLGLATGVFDWFVGAIQWAVPYMLLGAIVVVPVWLIRLALRMGRGR